MHERDLLVPTPDGAMPVFAAIPQDVPAAPGVLIYLDVFGPREELRDIARRFSSCGYVALLPQLFHRLGSPVFAPIKRPDEPLDAAAVRANGATTLHMSEVDTRAILDFAATGGLGVAVESWGAIGYCMGGRHALCAAVAWPLQVRAALSVHGGRLVDGSDNSPHRLLERATVPLHLAFARDDVTCPEPHQKLLTELAAASAGMVSVETLDAHHGWSFPERWCFDRCASERVWEQALTMFRKALWTAHAPRRREMGA